MAGARVRPGRQPALAFQALARAWIEPESLQGVLWSDGALAEHELERDTALLLQAAGPWGQGFPPPLFDNAFHVLEWRVLKERHLKLQLALLCTPPLTEMENGSTSVASVALPFIAFVILRE